MGENENENESKSGLGALLRAFKWFLFCLFIIVTALLLIILVVDFIRYGTVVNPALLAIIHFFKWLGGWIEQIGESHFGRFRFNPESAETLTKFL